MKMVKDEKTRRRRERGGVVDLAHCDDWARVVPPSP
jgi:hypothetical protein